MYPHEGSGESAPPANYLQPLPPAVPPNTYGGHGAPDSQAAHSRADERPRESGLLGKLGFHGRSGAEPDGDSTSRRRQRGTVPGRPLILGDLLAGIGALLVVLASLAPFVSYDSAKLTDDLAKNGLSTWFSAWSTQTFMAPLTWFIVIAAMLVVAISALRYLRSGDEERRILTFSLPQLQLVLALFPAVTLIGYAASRKSVLFGADYAAVVGKVPATTAFDTRLSLAFGGYLMVFGALVALAGAVLNLLDVTPVVWPRPAKPAPVPRGAPRTDSPFYGSAGPTSGPGAHAPVSGQPVSGQPVSGYPASGQPFGTPEQPLSGDPDRQRYGAAPEWEATQQWGGSAPPTWGDPPRAESTQLYGQVSDQPLYGRGPDQPSYGEGPDQPSYGEGPDQPWYEPNPTSEPRSDDQEYGQEYGQHSRRQNPPGTVYGRPP